MIKILTLSLIRAILRKKQTVWQTCQNLYGTCVPFLKLSKINGSVALTLFSLGVRDVTHG